MDGMEVSQYQSRENCVSPGSTGVLPLFLYSFTPCACCGAEEYRRWKGLRNLSSLPLVGPFFHKSVLTRGHERNETFVIPKNGHRAMEFIQECYQRDRVSSSYGIYLNVAMGKNKTLNFFLQVSSLLSYFTVFVSFYLLRGNKRYNFNIFLPL